MRKVRNMETLWRNVEETRKESSRAPRKICSRIRMTHKRNRKYPKTNTAHMYDEAVHPKILATSWRARCETVSRKYNCATVRHCVALPFLLPSLHEIPGFVRSHRVLLTSSRKASVPGLVRVQTVFLSRLRARLTRGMLTLTGAAFLCLGGSSHPRKWASIYPRSVRQYETHKISILVSEKCAREKWREQGNNISQSALRQKWLCAAAREDFQTAPESRRN